MILMSSMRQGFHVMRFALFAVLCLFFSLVFVVACDDSLDFGGINVLHDAMRHHLGSDLARSRILQDSVRAITVPTTAAVPDPLEPFTNHARVPDTGTASRDVPLEKDKPEKKEEEVTEVRARRKVVQSVTTQAEKGYVKYSWTRWLDMLYFSISNTITMGYGDIFPISPKAKLLVMTQIVCTFAVLCVEL